MDNIEVKETKVAFPTSIGVRRFELNRIIDGFFENMIILLTLLSATIILFIFFFILQKAWPVLKENGFHFVLKEGFDNQIRDAFNAPASAQVWTFGIRNLIIGTLTTTLGGLLIAVPMGVGTAIVIAEMTKGWVKTFMQSVIRLLAAIPSVIYGLIGILVVVPFIEAAVINVDMQIEYLEYFQLTGRGMLAGIVVLSCMVVPIIIALSVDAINAVPKKYKEAALALGLSKWRMIIKVVLPAAKSGIFAGIILGAGRGAGEAIALSMVSGSLGVFPRITHGGVFFLTPVLPLASAIVNKSEAIAVPSIESALFGCAVVLLITTTLLSICTKFVEAVVRRRQGIE